MEYRKRIKTNFLGMKRGCKDENMEKGGIVTSDISDRAKHVHDLYIGGSSTNTRTQQRETVF